DPVGKVPRSGTASDRGAKFASEELTRRRYAARRPQATPESAVKQPASVRLTDDQINAVFAASYPLPPDRRSAFLEACAIELAQLPEAGDGAVHRVVMAVQRRYFDRPVSHH